MKELEQEVLKAIRADPDLAGDWYVQKNHEAMVAGIAALYRAVAREGDLAYAADFNAWVQAVARAHLATFTW